MRTNLLGAAFCAAAILFSTMSCKQKQENESGYIGPSDITVTDGLMTPEVMLSLGRLSDPQLSPDGTKVLYGVSYTSLADNRSCRNLFMSNIDGSDKVQLTRYAKSVSNARWSLDGKEIYFLQGGQVWKAPLQGNKLGKKVVLKVILETGLLVTPERIAEASFLAMEEGADFIKTSTGKVSVNATPMAAYIMCECVKAFYEKTGRKVGFKAAGGISTAKDAVCYYSIVKTILGEEWLNKSLFRFGVSRLANSLMSAIEQKTVSYF